MVPEPEGADVAALVPEPEATGVWHCCTREETVGILNVPILGAEVSAKTVFASPSGTARRASGALGTGVGVGLDLGFVESVLVLLTRRCLRGGSSSWVVEGPTSLVLLRGLEGFGVGGSELTLERMAEEKRREFAYRKIGIERTLQLQSQSAKARVVFVLLTEKSVSSILER